MNQRQDEVLWPVLALALVGVTVIALAIVMPANALTVKRLGLLQSGNKKVLVEAQRRLESLQMGLRWGVLRFDAKGCLYYQLLEKRNDPDTPHPLPTSWTIPRVVILPKGTKFSNNGKALTRGKWSIPIGKAFEGLPSGIDYDFTVSESGMYPQSAFPAACRPELGSQAMLLALGDL